MTTSFPDLEGKLRHYAVMRLIRVFEEEVDVQFKKGNIFGTTHLCIGQEAVAVGVCHNLTDDDLIVSNHRNHGHFLAKGGHPGRVMAELMGRVAGYARGKGGSQHMAEPAIGHLGSNGITGGGVPIATGAAFAIKHRGEARIATVFLGDGATSQGVVHEAMNLAKLHELPILFVCENNRYAMSVPVQSGVSGDLVRRVSGYGITAESVDGMDAEAVLAAVAKARQEMLESYRPHFIEARTYRYLGHSKSDKREYRTREEEEQYRQRDPIQGIALTMTPDEQAQVASIDNRVRTMVDEAVDYALASEYPNPDILEGAV